MDLFNPRCTSFINRCCRDDGDGMTIGAANDTHGCLDGTVVCRCQRTWRSALQFDFQEALSGAIWDTTLGFNLLVSHILLQRCTRLAGYSPHESKAVFHDCAVHSPLLCLATLAGSRSTSKHLPGTGRSHPETIPLNLNEAQQRREDRCLGRALHHPHLASWEYVSFDMYWVYGVLLACIHSLQFWSGSTTRSARS